MKIPPGLLFAISALFLLSCDTNVSRASEPEQATVVSPAVETIDTNYHNGDIIFQSSMSGQSMAIQLATHSVYSHCGLLFSDNGRWYVYEAVQPVKKTPVEEFISRGDNNYFVVKRLAGADSILDAAAMKKMRQAVNSHLGKNYDLWFGWNDERIYCSELVWKAYKDATGLEVGAPKPMGEYDLTHPEVQRIMKQRYGNDIPKDELMISPGSIFESKLLVTVRE